MNRLFRSAAVGAVFAAFAGQGAAQEPRSPLKLGVINDMSGRFSSIGGMGSVEAARFAVEDFGGKVLGRPIEVVFADHYNKADVAATTVRSWFDEGGVSAAFDGGNSGASLAVQAIAHEKRRIFAVSGAGATDLTGAQCSPYAFLFTFNSYALGAASKALVARGDNTWFFLTADYAFGHSLQQDTSRFIQGAGGTVTGSIRVPFENHDYSSFLLQAQASKAKVIALATAGGETINALKQAYEFGIGQTNDQRLSALFLLITDIHTLGLQTTKGLIFGESFYWNLNEKTRAFGKRFMAKMGGQAPTMVHAGVYSAVLHYLKAVKEAKTDGADAVAAAMRKLPVEDFMTNRAAVRADGQVMRDIYVMQVKSPEESREPWDYEKLLATIPADEAWIPLAESKCPLARRAH
jgi:branched-chain amino acid transport system substrate-binding protein